MSNLITTRRRITAFFCLFGFIMVIVFYHSKNNNFGSLNIPKSGNQSDPPAIAYYQKIYANPETGEMSRPTPQAQQYWMRMIKNQQLQKRDGEDEIEWIEVGPTNVGGRTRAIAIDRQNPQRLIAGGVRGGLWESDNYGDHWDHIKGITENESITFITQHPSELNTWYATTGEFVGSGANFFGGGLLFSMDNGNSWDIQHFEYTYDTLHGDFTYRSALDLPISSATPPFNTNEGYPFQYASKLLVHPDSQSIFVATHGWGILRSSDNIQSFTHNLPPNPERYDRQLLPLDTSTILLLRFDGSLTGEQGESPIQSSDIEYRPGVFGQGIHLDTNDILQYASIDNIHALAGTVEFWIQPDWNGTNKQENAFLDFGDYPFFISLRKVFEWVEILVATGEDGNQWYGAGSDISDWKSGEWHHLAFTWDSTAVATYFDGVQVGITEPQVPLPDITKELFQMGVPWGDGIGGVIDELRISNRARSVSEINQSFQFGNLGMAQKSYPTFRPDFSDISIGSDGTILAYLSGKRNEGSGVYRSNDNGFTWDDITPEDWPDLVQRGIIEIAPSNPDLAYLLTLSTGAEMSFYKFDLLNQTYENRSQNLPTEGVFPGDYYLVMNVKPDDENLIIIGGINLFRSIDAFANPIEDPTINYIQNYMHVDNHLIYYNPFDPKEVWAVNDGGIYFSEDITRISGNYDNVRWQDKDNNYNVTQFYSVGQSSEPTDHRVIGGAQDNGYLQVYPPEPKVPWRAFGNDFGSDGGYVYVTPEYTYMSFQLGETYRLTRGPQGDAEWAHGWIGISPAAAPGRDFIHPWAVDPMDENTMYYPIWNNVYRVDSIDQTPMYEFYGEENFDLVSDGDLNGHDRVTAIAVTSEPAHTLLFASTGEKPIIKRVRNAHKDGFVVEDVSIHNATASWTNTRCIAPNPADGNEWLVVITNFDVPSLYHTRDGGQSYVLVEGNLAGTEAIPGPSMEWAEILNFEDKNYYFLATRIGVFMTHVLDGANTIWTHTGTDVIGYALAMMIQARESDGKIVVGTHGRGFFAGYLTEPLVSDIQDPVYPPLELQVIPNPAQEEIGIYFSLGTSDHLAIQIYDMSGKRVWYYPSQSFSAGPHQVFTNVKELPSGLYLVGLMGQKSSRFKRMIKF